MVSKYWEPFWLYCGQAFLQPKAGVFYVFAPLVYLRRCGRALPHTIPGSRLVAPQESVTIKGMDTASPAGLVRVDTLDFA